MLSIPLVGLVFLLYAYYPSCMLIIPHVQYAYSPSCLLTVYYPFSVLIFPLVCFFLWGLPFCMYYCTVYIVLDEKKILKMLYVVCLSSLLYAYHSSCMLSIPLLCLLSLLYAYAHSCMLIIPLVCLLSLLYA